MEHGRARVGSRRVWLKLSGPMETKRGFYTKVCTVSYLPLVTSCSVLLTSHV